MDTETLECEGCEASWTRTRTRGRKPRFCPTCVSSNNTPKPAATAPKQRESREPAVNSTGAISSIPPNSDVHNIVLSNPSDPYEWMDEYKKIRTREGW